MMYRGEDRQALQTLIDNGTITLKIQQTPKLILHAIQTTIKEDEHFHHYCNEPVTDLCQKPDEPIHSPNIHIIQLTNNWCLNSKTKETLIIIILQHIFRFHEAQDWIYVQDQSTYNKLLSNRRTLHSVNNSKRAKEKGCAKLSMITAATVSTSSIHQDILNTHIKCGKCSYNHTKGNGSV